MIKPVRIGDRLVGPGQPCFIIAEAGVNHNGSFTLAKQLVDLAAECGVDAIKFQTFVTDHVESKSALKPSYFVGRESEEDKKAFSRSLELSFESFAELKKHAELKGVIFLSTACDPVSLDFLVNLGVSAVKIGSSDTNNFPLLRKAARTGLPIILSTGISTMEGVRSAIDDLRENHCDQLIVMQCTSSYPIQPSDVHLNVMQTYMDQFFCPVGLSDHTMGIHVAMAAAALGASIIEKHFTISRHLPGVDHPASLEPREMRELVEGIRAIESAFGKSEKSILPVEEEYVITMRKSIVAARDLPAGTVLSSNDLLVKRPGTGIPPSEIDRLIGKRLKVPVNNDELLSWEMLE
jgi:sialic acid synthase SpsE